jgi:hypothetical protein
MVDWGWSQTPEHRVPGRDTYPVPRQTWRVRRPTERSTRLRGGGRPGAVAVAAGEPDGYFFAPRGAVPGPAGTGEGRPHTPPGGVGRAGGLAIGRTAGALTEAPGPRDGERGVRKPLQGLKLKWCRRAESNRRHEDFQFAARVSGRPRWVQTPHGCAARAVGCAPRTPPVLHGSRGSGARRAHGHHCSTALSPPRAAVIDGQTLISYNLTDPPPQRAYAVIDGQTLISYNCCNARKYPRGEATVPAMG